MDAYLEELSEHFARMRPRLEVVAARVLGSHSEAADVVSEVYLALTRTQPSNPEALAAWLFVSVRNRALKRLRGAGRSGPFPDQDPEAPVEVSELESAALAEVLSQAVKRLSDRDRAFVTARFYEGASTEVLAAQHQVTASQTRIILHRAIARLRRRLVEELAAHHDVPVEHREAVTRMVAKGEFEVACRCAACGRLDDEISALRKLRGVLPFAFPKGWMKKAAVGVGAVAVVVGAPAGRVPDASAEPIPPLTYAPTPEEVETFAWPAAEPRWETGHPAATAAPTAGGPDSAGEPSPLPRIPKTNSKRPFTYKNPLGGQAPVLSLPVEEVIPLPDLPKVRPGSPIG